MEKLCYLAGPITGLSYGDATDWRKYCIDRFDKKVFGSRIIGLSPLRCKNYLLQEKVLAQHYDEYILSTAKGITTRDRWDCMRCDVVLANFLGAKTVSIGTVMEIAWADSQRIPVVCVMEDGNIHQHAMLKEVSGFIVDDLDKGIDVVSALLS